MSQRHICKRTIPCSEPTTNWEAMADELFIDPPALKKIASRLYSGGSDCELALDPTYQFLRDGMFGGRREDTRKAFVAWFLQEDDKVRALVKQTQSHSEHLDADAKLFEAQSELHKTTLQRQEV